jgi:hypothetical protein
MGNLGFYCYLLLYGSLTADLKQLEERLSLLLCKISGLIQGGRKTSNGAASGARPMMRLRFS